MLWKQCCQDDVNSCGFSSQMPRPDSPELMLVLSVSCQCLLDLSPAHNTQCSALNAQPSTLSTQCLKCCGRLAVSAQEAVPGIDSGLGIPNTVVFVANPDHIVAHSTGHLSCKSEHKLPLDKCM